MSLHFITLSDQQGFVVTSIISRRVQRVKPSPTVALTGRVAQLKAEGKDIISLGVGEPDFDTPAHIADAGVDAIRKGVTRYTPVEGTAELRTPSSRNSSARISSTISATRSWFRPAPSRPSSISFSHSSMPGDEAIIPAPYWVSYPDMVMLADGIAGHRVCRPEQGYKITASPARSRDHAAHEAVHAEQSEQSDGRRLHSRGTARLGRSADASIRRS